ncbi:MAG: MMPL family transporter, partial [Pseudomonadales bacterium]|nr:MMPL family transporter [Pseudomonadales bacterium]
MGEPMVDMASSAAMEYRETATARVFDKAVLGRPWLVVCLLAVLTVFFAFHARNYKVDASADSLVLEGDEDLEFYRNVMQRYDSAEFLIVAYQPQADLLADESLAALDALVADLSAINGVASVLSLLDVPLLYSPKVSITALSNGVQTLRNPQVDRELVAAELRDSPIYRQLLTSIEGDTAALQINLARDERYASLLQARESLRKQRDRGELDAAGRQQLRDTEREFKAYATVAAEQQRQLVANTRAVLDSHQASAKKMYLGGVPMIANDMVKFVKSDLQTFGLGILAFIIVLLTVIFRSPRWVILPLAACLMTNIFMLGLLGLLDWRMTVISSNFVALLLIITLAVSVHLIVRYRELQAQYPSD